MSPFDSPGPRDRGGAHGSRSLDGPTGEGTSAAGAPVQGPLAGGGHPPSRRRLTPRHCEQRSARRRVPLRKHGRNVPDGVAGTADGVIRVLLPEQPPKREERGAVAPRARARTPDPSSRREREGAGMCSLGNGLNAHTFRNE